jgi:hypothetical protein
MRNDGSSHGLGWTSLILGAALAGTGLLAASLACVGIACDDSAAAATWNAGLAGTLIACCSAAALYRHQAWADWSNLVLGGWTVAAPFLLGFGPETPAWMHVAVGSCAAAIAALQLLAIGEAQRRPRVESAAHR